MKSSSTLRLVYSDQNKIERRPLKMGLKPSPKLPAVYLPSRPPLSELTLEIVHREIDELAARHTGQLAGIALMVRKALERDDVFIDRNIPEWFV